MFHYEFPQTKKTILRPMTIICNTCEQTNLVGNILNSGENLVDKEDYGFTGSSFKVAPIIIYDIT